MNEEASVRPTQSGLNHIGLSVADLERSIAFYCDILGAELVWAPRLGASESSTWRFALIRLGHFGVDLVEHAGNGGEAFEPARTGLDHIGLAARSSDDLEAWARWLDARNVRRSEIRISEAGAIFDLSIQTESSWTSSSSIRVGLVR
jgi:glyoxylase I family protein